MVLPGFPDSPGSREFAARLQEAGVRLIEVVDPIPDGWAPTTNDIIRQAHRTALAQADRPTCYDLARGFVGTLKILYQGHLTGDRQAVIEANVGQFSILQFAFGPNTFPDLDAAALPLPTTTFVPAESDPTVLTQAARSAEWLVVCRIGDRTGGTLLDRKRIQDALALLQAEARVPVFCTFGISDADTLGWLRQTGSCDGVIIGTAFLERLAGGVSTCTDLIRELTRAAFC
jgi:tryptophan synthase alpha subunit